MSAIWQIGLSNAALVTAGTPIVWLVGRYGKRPALTHGLAVLLLLKLITPPLWRVPVSWPDAPPLKLAVETRPNPLLPDVPLVEHDVAALAMAPIPEGAIPTEASPSLTQVPAVRPPSPAKPIAKKFDFDRLRRLWIPLLGWVWTAGSALCALVACTRVVRFSRALRYATRATDVQPRADLLARRLKMRGSPAVWFVTANVPPMLWSLGRRPRLLIPEGLWERLDVPGRDTILLHELAHWKRGDNVVRWIELIATCLFWWLPACWWARRELREAEEQCCDAWVLWAMPGVFKNYANALLEAVEFLSIGVDRPSARSAVPALASRMGQFVHLRRRLTMLKHGNIARALSWGGLAGVMTLGSLVLPVAPTWAQEQTAPEEAPRLAQPAPTAPGPQGAPATERWETVGTDSRADNSKQTAAAMELDRARQTIDRLRKQLDMAQARLQKLEAESKQQPIRRWIHSYDPAPDAAPPAAPGTATLPFLRGGGEIQLDPAPQPTPPAAPGEAPEPMLLTPAPGVHKYAQYRVIITDPVTGAIKEIQTRPMAASPKSQDWRQDQEVQAHRLDQIEKQLRMMMDEIAAMRQTAAPQPAPRADPFSPAKP